MAATDYERIQNIQVSKKICIFNFARREVKNMTRDINIFGYLIIQLKALKHLYFPGRLSSKNQLLEFPIPQSVRRQSNGLLTRRAGSYTSMLVSDNLFLPGCEVPVNVILRLEVGHPGGYLGAHVDQLRQLQRPAFTCNHIILIIRNKVGLLGPD